MIGKQFKVGDFVELVSSDISVLMRGQVMVLPPGLIGKVIRILPSASKHPIQVDFGGFNDGYPGDAGWDSYFNPSELRYISPLKVISAITTD